MPRGVASHILCERDLYQQRLRTLEQRTWKRNTFRIFLKDTFSCHLFLSIISSILFCLCPRILYTVINRVDAAWHLLRDLLQSEQLQRDIVHSEIVTPPPGPQGPHHIGQGRASKILEGASKILRAP